ncbi:MAG: MurR/RpiR family transcriptional regulator [Eubacteriales bacterium]|nr:MurR/RpiR family transcriptional regulator [Eubacteriales bacterium]
MSEQDNNIFAKISSEYFRFTASEKKTADYVLSHKTDIQYMSISEMAYEIGVAEATISRFCRSLGLRGYNDFKLSLAKATALRELDADALAGSSAAAGHVGPAGNAGDMLGNAGGNSTAAHGEAGLTENSGAGDSEISKLTRNLVVTYNDAIRQTAAFVNERELRKAVELLADAELVYCMGQGGSMLMAMEASHLFSTVSPRFFAVQGSHVQVSKAALMNEKDVVLFFSYSGSTKEILELISIAKERKAKVILITRFLRSPGAKEADVVLQCGSDEGPLQLSSVPAKIAQMFVVDMLYQELCRIRAEQTRENRESVAKALAEKHL